MCFYAVDDVIVLTCCHILSFVIYIPVYYWFLLCKSVFFGLIMRVNWNRLKKGGICNYNFLVLIFSVVSFDCYINFIFIGVAYLKV